MITLAIAILICLVAFELQAEDEIFKQRLAAAVRAFQEITRVAERGSVAMEELRVSFAGVLGAVERRDLL